MRVLLRAIAFTLLAFSSVRIVKAGNCPDGSSGTTIFFGNGVDTTEDDAVAETLSLQSALEMRISETGAAIQVDCLKYRLAYNRDTGILTGIFQSADQSLLGDWTHFWRIWARLDWFQSLADAAYKSIDQATYVVEADLRRDLEKYQAETAAQNRIILVAHSQGNLYGNEAYRLLYLNDTPIPSGAFSIVAGLLTAVPGSPVHTGTNPSFIAAP